MKALRVGIFEDKYTGNCSNNGISARYNSILLIDPDGYIDIDESAMPENLCKRVVRRIGNDIFVHVEPVSRPEDGCVGWMFGGSLVYTSDSRFGEPLKLHDRQESWDLYEKLSG